MDARLGRRGIIATDAVYLVPGVNGVFVAFASRGSSCRTPVKKRGAARDHKIIQLCPTRKRVENSLLHDVARYNRPSSRYETYAVERTSP